MTARLRAARSWWQAHRWPAQLALTAAVAVPAGVVAVLVFVATQGAWNRDGAAVVIALVAVWLSTAVVHHVRAWWRYR